MKSAALLLMCFVCCLSTLRAQRFDYPVPPDSIVGSKERAEYMARHFWSERTATDFTLFDKPRLLQDYIYLLGLLDEDSRNECVASFVQMVSKCEQAFTLMTYWLDVILYNSSSKHYDEELYIVFLQAILNAPVTETLKLVPENRMKSVQKNRVGHKANDFQFIDKQGRRHHLYDMEAPYILLIFNSPECSRCQQTETELMTDSILQVSLKNLDVMILAITPEADRSTWECHEYPRTWIPGYDSKGKIYKKRLYDIQSLPCIYLLDAEKKVLIKEADHPRLRTCLEVLNGAPM